MSSQDVANSRYVFSIKPQDGENFWDVNKELLNLFPYAELFKKEGKRRSGRIMTAMWMMYDPKSRVQQSGGRKEDEVQQDIAKNFLKEPKFDWKNKDIKKVIEVFKMDCRTFAEEELMNWEIELRLRTIYQRTLPWDTERKEKDEMLSTQKKLEDQYLAVKKEVEKERSDFIGHGGTQKSTIERMGSSN